MPSTQPPPALTSTVPPELVDPVAVVQSFYKAYNEGDVEAAMAFIADDFNYKLYRSGSLAATGVDAVMEIKDGKIIYFEIN